MLVRGRVQREGSGTWRDLRLVETAGATGRQCRAGPRNVSCSVFHMLRPWQSPGSGQRDLRIDWLRGLVMTCVIIDHSRLSSLLSWFSYERFWTVTAAEV